MRKDEDGNDCPATLGEYRDLCASIGGEKSPAVAFLDKKIAETNRDEEVIAPDSQMRVVLMPMLLQDPVLHAEYKAGEILEELANRKGKT
jgi:hypothetical protein